MFGLRSEGAKTRESPTNFIPLPRCIEQSPSFFRKDLKKLFITLSTNFIAVRKYPVYESLRNALPLSQAIHPAGRTRGLQRNGLMFEHQQCVHDLQAKLLHKFQ